MAQYNDDYLVSVRTQGQESLKGLARGIETLDGVMKGVIAEGNRVSALDGIDKRFGISDTTLASYDTLKRLLNDVRTARLKLAEVMDRSTLSADIGYGNKHPETGDAAFRSDRQEEIALRSAVSAASRANETAVKAAIKYADAISGRAEAERAQKAQDAASAAQVREAAADRARAEKEAAAQVRQGLASMRRIGNELRAAEEERVKSEKQAADAARQQGLRAVDSVLAQQPVRNYPNADLSTHVGRAQSSVDQAETALKIANLKLASERSSESRSVASVMAAENRVAASASALASAQERLELVANRTSGSLAQQFRTGFKGTNADRSYAEQIGQAFKFSVFYGTAYRLLSAITATMQSTLQEGIAFQQAMTELAVASGAPKDALDKLSTSLGSQATQAGFAPSQGVLVGAQSLGLYGAAAGSGASVAEQSRIAEISARIVSRVALGSGQQPADIQANLAAISQAFGTGAQGQVRSYDLDAYLTRRFGVTPGSTLAPVSEAATVGKAAGFDQAQVTAIAAVLEARTGSTPEAVAGYMAQIFSRAGEGALVGVDQKYGVDSSKPLAQQLAALAKVYARDPSSRDEISAVGGRGKVQNAFIALLQDYAHVQAEARRANRDSTGSGDEQFNLRMKNLGGQIAQTVGALKDFASALASSGVLTDIGVLVVAVRNLTESATGLLREWNQLPEVIKATAVALAALTLAAKLTGGAGALAGRVGLAASGEGALTRLATTSQLGGKLYGPGTRLISPTFTELGAAEAGAAVPLASRAGAGVLARNAINSAGGFGVAAAVLGDIYLWGGLRNATTKLTAAQDQASAGLNHGLSPNATSDALKAQSQYLSELATQSDEAQNGPLAFITGGKFGLGPNRSDLGAQSQRLRDEAARLNQVASYKAVQEASVSPTQALVTGLDPEGLSSSMAAITASGGTARERLAALNATLLGTANASDRVKAAFDPKAFAGQNADRVFRAIQSGGAIQSTTRDSSLYKALDSQAFGLLPSNNGTTTDIGPELVQKYLTQGDVQQRLQAQLAGVTDLGKLDKGKLYSIASKVVGDLPDKIGADAGLDIGGIITLRENMTNRVAKILGRQTKVVKEILRGGGIIDGTQLTAVVNQEVADTQELIGNLPTSDYTGRIDKAQTLVRTILNDIRHSSSGATPAVQQQLDAARKAVAEAQITRLEALRKVAQHEAHGDKAVAAAGRGFFVREVNAAIRGGDTDALVNLVQTAGDYGKRIVKNALDVVLKTARAAAAMAAEFAAYARNEVAGIEHQMGRPGGPTGTTNAQQKLLDRIHAMEAAVDSTASGSLANDPFYSGSDAGRKAAPTGAAAETAAQRAAALASANAVRSESQIQQARAAIQSARAEMGAAKKGTVEYYSALSSLYDAQNQLTDAILEYQSNKYLLNHDATDPLVQARASLVAARAKLRSDRGKPGDVRAADQVAVQQAQADAEAAAFNQRLEAVQTAESLGRISHSAYLNYLNHERTRLRQIAHRSYQQQQELNQIDELLKTAADQMQGQWNFGDIKLPTPYQVRRYIEQHSGAVGSEGVGGSSSRTTNNNTTITIDGADTGAVLRILRKYVGQNGRTMTTGTRHR